MLPTETLERESARLWHDARIARAELVAEPVDRSGLEPEAFGRETETLERELLCLARSSQSATRFIKTPSAARRAEWRSSRSALVRVAQRLRAHGVARERMLFSLSHSAKLSLAVGIENHCERVDCRCAVGVDLESEDRVISAKGAALIARPDELATGLTPLQLWVVKEACFKANASPVDTIVADYEVTVFDRTAGLGHARCAKASLELRFQLLESNGFTVALALGKCELLAGLR